LKILLRIGGSVLGSPPDAKVVEDYARAISHVLEQKQHEVAVVVGGGSTARQYIETAKKLGLSHREQDLIAIQASRLNAKLVGMKLGVPAVPITVRGMVSSVAKDGVAVMGGLKPGITTDTVATLVAEAWHADLLIKASNQDGIYTSDPRVRSDAKLLTTVSYPRLAEILGGRHVPGIHSIVDPIAVEQIVRMKLKLVVINGDTAENVMRVLRGEKIGTTVS
jgi:uridylate kinase